jgi:hypothetical protein
MKGILFWLDLWALGAGTRYFCSAIAALFGPFQIYFFLKVHFHQSSKIKSHEEVTKLYSLLDDGRIREA